MEVDYQNAHDILNNPFSWHKGNRIYSRGRRDLETPTIATLRSDLEEQAAETYAASDQLMILRRTLSHGND